MEKELIFDGTICSPAWNYDAYLQMCHDLEEEPFSEDSAEFGDWRAWQMEEGLNDFLELLKAKKLLDRKIVVSGYLGLWDGEHEIYPKEFSNFSPALTAMIGDSGGYQIFRENRQMRFESYHHDGTNVFFVSFMAKGKNVPIYFPDIFK